MNVQLYYRLTVTQSIKCEQDSGFDFIILINNFKNNLKTNKILIYISITYQFHMFYKV